MKLESIFNLFTIIPLGSTDHIAASVVTLDDNLKPKAVQRILTDLVARNLVDSSDKLIALSVDGKTHLFNSNTRAFPTESYLGFYMVDLLGEIFEFGIVYNSFTFIVNFDAEVDPKFTTLETFDNGDPKRFDLELLKQDLSKTLFTGADLPNGVKAVRTSEILSQINSGCLDDGENFFIACQY